MTGEKLILQILFKKAIYYKLGPLAQLVAACVLYTQGRGFEPHMDQLIHVGLITNMDQWFI